jgi:hypothetical protein
MKKKGIEAADVKKLPLIDDMSEPIAPSPMVEVNSLYQFDGGDVPYGKPPSQCLDEIDSILVKQQHFDMDIQRQLQENACIIRNLHVNMEKTTNDVKGIIEHCAMIQV